VSDLNLRYFNSSKNNYQSEESASIPKEEIVKLFESVESEAITEKEFCEMATEIIERAVMGATV
jgi:hypothetical protein